MYMKLLFFHSPMAENTNLEQHTQQQKATLANTIGSKKGISLSV